MDKDDEVTLAKQPGWRGRVTGRNRRGNIDVEFIGGGHGSFPEEDLVPVEDKAWPPPTMETKTA